MWLMQKVNIVMQQASNKLNPLDSVDRQHMRKILLKWTGKHIMVNIIAHPGYFKMSPQKPVNGMCFYSHLVLTDLKTKPLIPVLDLEKKCNWALITAAVSFSLLMHSHFIEDTRQQMFWWENPLNIFNGVVHVRMALIHFLNFWNKCDTSFGIFIDSLWFG